ncbi:MAG: DNA-3-methyladenine glycosylase family protein [Christensenellales bacterium]|jgi:N-glycosylase/DNA lyase
MKYITENNKIVITDKSEFNPLHIMECGQVFTYEKAEDVYRVFSKNKLAVVKEFDDKVEILTDDVPYFENYFDLKTDYFQIKQSLRNAFPQMIEMLEFGNGIRILKQDILETVVGFIISANNNISRIKNSMAYIRKNLGQNMGDFYAFPTLEVLAQQDEEFFVKAGLGYRAKQIVKAFKQMQEINFEELRNLPTKELKEKLLTINGIGSKVADCILLFAYGKQDVFPVDTWIEKIFKRYFDQSETDREKMRFKLLETFGNQAGYAQQYMFYFIRK